MGKVIFSEFRAKLEALIKTATDEDLTNGGRYFKGTNLDLTRCGHGDTGEFLDKDDGKLIELLWNNRREILEGLQLGWACKTGHSIGEMTVELTADTKAVQEMLRERQADLELMETNLATERTNADKLAAMLRYLMREIGEAGHEISHQVMLLDTQTTLGDIIDGMLLQHDYLAAQRDPNQ